MYRQFVNLIVHEERSALYSMRRLGIIPHLFHESPAAADAQDSPAKTNGCLSTISSCNGLPRSAINFVLPSKISALTPMHFFSLLRGQGEGCVMFAAPHHQNTVYDVAMQSALVVPPNNFSKPSDSIALPMTPSQGHYQLYVLGRVGGMGNASFEVFNYCRVGAATVGARQWWYWNALPSPPLVERNLLGNEMCPTAAAVVDEKTICVSSIGGGAYTFNTVEREWRQAGSWVLPFHGAAEYVPELDLWFAVEATGGQSRGHRLCAFDLSSSWPPVAQHAWDYLDDGLLELDDGWLPCKRVLLNLGSGRFCIATTFRKAVKTFVPGYPSDDEELAHIEDRKVTLLTGVDVVRCGSGMLEMIKHKSQLYDIEGMSIHCVL